MALFQFSISRLLSGGGMRSGILLLLRVSNEGSVPETSSLAHCVESMCGVDDLVDWKGMVLKVRRNT